MRTSLLYTLFTSVFILGYFFFGTSPALATPCHLYQAGSIIPNGFGAPYSVVTATAHLLISADCTGATTTVQVGSGSGLEYVFNQAYVWTGTAWNPLLLTGGNLIASSWLVGNGSTVLQNIPGQQTYVVGYVCTWTGTEWKCGCKDAACITNLWQLQVFISSQTGGGSSSSGGGSSGSGNVQHSQFVPQGYSLTFNDEFDGPLDLDDCGNGAKWVTYFCKWNVRVLWDNSERAVKTHEGYTNNGATLGVKLHEITGGGTLKLYGKEWPAANKQAFIDEPYYSDLPWLGGMISTEESHYITFGYWETRVKMNNVSKGHHIAFWLIPKSGDWPPEIDLLEVSNDNDSAQNKFFFNSHGGPNNNINWVDVTPTEMQEWHTIAFLWTDSEMIWYLDGEEVRKHANYVNQDMYFLIAPEIGGHWPGKPNGNTVWPMEVEIDYVRVYTN